MDRQVIILTHDRQWYTELRHQLEHNSKWLFKTLLPYPESTEGGCRVNVLRRPMGAPLNLG